jgi:hypothetical protein
LDAVSSLMDIHRRGKQIAADKDLTNRGLLKALPHEKDGGDLVRTERDQVERVASEEWDSLFH